MKKIVFVCTGNTCRSPMAEVMFREMSKGMGLEVTSAGLFAGEGQPMSENARLALMERGLDGSKHRSRQLRAEMLEDAAAVCMTAGHLEMLRAICPGKCRMLAEHDISDPYGMPLSSYKNSCEEIYSALMQLMEQISKGEI